MSAAFVKQSLPSKSSNRSNNDCFLPSKFTGGSSVQALTIFRGTPLASIALPKGSLDSEAPSQLTRSAKASKGLAEAWTPLSPVLGSDLNLSDVQLLKMVLRNDPGAAVFGSVPPSTLPRKSAQERPALDHCVSK